MNKFKKRSPIEGRWVFWWYSVTTLMSNISRFSFFIGLSFSTTNTSLAFYILGMSIVFGSGFQLLSMYFVKLSTKNITELFLPRTLLRKDLSKSNEKTILKYIRTLLNVQLSKADLYVALICIALCTFWLSQQRVGNIALILSLILAVTLFSVLLGKMTARIFEKLLKISHQREDCLDEILSSKNQINGESKKIDGLEKLFVKENRLRSIESILLSLESYLPASLKYFIPIIAYIVYGAQSFESQVFWVSIPLVTIILSIPRHLSSVKKEKLILENISNLGMIQQGGGNDSKFFAFESKDSVWKGTLYENIPHYDSQVDYLIESFGLTSMASRDVIDKHSVSAGEKDRVLLIRYLAKSVAVHKSLIINYDFSSIDKRTLNRLMKSSNEYSIRNGIEVLWGITEREDDSNLNAPVVELETRLDGRSDKEVLKRHIPRRYLLVCLSLGIVFIGSALLDGLTFQYINSNPEKNSYFQLIPLVLLVSVLPVFIGTAIEHYIRIKVVRDFIDSLKKLSLSSFEARNYSVAHLPIVLEIFCYYTHDFLWFSAVLAATVVVAWIGIGPYTLVASVVFLFCLTFLYKVFFPKIKSSKDAMVVFASDIVFEIEKKNALLKYFDYSTKDRCESLGGEAIKSYGDAFYTNQKVKMDVSILSQLLVVFLIFGNMLLVDLSSASSNWLSVFLVIIVRIESESIRAFGSFSGLMSTKSSLDKLYYMKNSTTELLKGTAYSDQEGVNISEFEDGSSGVRYLQSKFTFGVSILKANSGVGKSRYMESLYNICSGTSRGASIVDTKFNSATEALMSIESGMVADIMLVDEALTDIGLMESIELVNSIHKIATELQKVVIVVDHRLASNT